ncbi:MAG: hypothetical protein P4M11_11195 [Candidatus Pacebacteria bacterium]|nr:hypothetical protein [Candidatus Paceibacterota bacterium]
MLRRTIIFPGVEGLEHVGQAKNESGFHIYDILVLVLRPFCGRIGGPRLRRQLNVGALVVLGEDGLSRLRRELTFLVRNSANSSALLICDFSDC